MLPLLCECGRVGDQQWRAGSNGPHELRWIGAEMPSRHRAERRVAHCRPHPSSLVTKIPLLECRVSLLCRFSVVRWQVHAETRHAHHASGTTDRRLNVRYRPCVGVSSFGGCQLWESEINVCTSALWGAPRHAVVKIYIYIIIEVRTRCYEPRARGVQTRVLVRTVRYRYT